MGEEFLNLTRMASELMCFCHTKGATTFDLQLTLDGPRAVVRLNAPGLVLTADEIEKIRETTGRPRREEIGEYYGPLAGCDHGGTELNLLALMADRIEVRTEPDEGTTFIVERTHVE